MNTPDNLENISNMICDWCGRVFPATPRAVVDTIITLKDDIDSKEISDLMIKLGLTDNEMNQLLLDGELNGVPAIVCLECQDEDD